MPDTILLLGLSCLYMNISKWMSLMHVCLYTVYTCFLQSGQLISALRVVVPMCHWGSFEIVSQVHWVRGGALQCTTTIGRIGLCDRRPGAYGQSGAAQNLHGTRVNKKNKINDCVNKGQNERERAESSAAILKLKCLQCSCKIINQQWHKQTRAFLTIPQLGM